MHPVWTAAGDEGAAFATLTPLAGGYSGETFLADGGGQRTVVRVYAASGAQRSAQWSAQVSAQWSAQRGPDAPEVDAGVLRLVRGLVPVPDVL